MPTKAHKIASDYGLGLIPDNRLYYSEEEIKLLQDDTFIRMDKKMLEKFKEFCKVTADNSDFKTASPKLKRS